jgi:RNA polymerase sigma factor (sigma-70 family)
MVAAARAGDLRAWLGITRRYQEALFRSAWITSRDAAAAEEIAGRTFTRAYRSMDSLDDGAAVLPWLMTISTTVARAYLRELAQRRDARSIDLITSPRLPAAPYRQDPRLPSPTRFEREALVSAFDRASDHDRLILASRYGFGLDRASAAARLGASPDEIEKDLRASIRRLREHVVEAIAEPVLSGPRSVESAAGAFNVPAQRGHQAPGRTSSLPDDALGALTMSAVLAEMTWTPDVAIIVFDGLAREAVTYPAGHERRDRGSASHHERSIAARAGASSTGDPGTAVAGGAPQRRGWSFPRSTALLLGAALVAFSFAATASGPGTSGDVGARVAALFGQADADEAAMDVRPGIAQGIPTSVSAAPSAVPNEPSTLPQVDDALGLSIVSARARASGDVAARVRLDWERPPEMGTVVRTRLERRVGDGEWTTIERVDRAGPVRAAIKARERYAFRLR